MKRDTVELMAFRCPCGKAVIRATVTKLAVGVHGATVENQVVPCPACGSTDIKAARKVVAGKPRA